MDDAKIWSVVFVSVALIGFLMISILFLTSLDIAIANGLRLLSIFLGMLAGTALGEYLKIRNKRKAGRILLDDIIEELKVNKNIIDTGLPLRKGFWTLGIRSGTAQNIPDLERRKLWDIYSNITHYNEDLQALHISRFTEGLSTTPEVHAETMKLRTLILQLINEYLMFKKIKLSVEE